MLIEKEQDLKNQSVQPELTLDQKRFLSTLTDDDSYGLYAQCDSAVFSQDIILYRKKDTLVDGNTYCAIYEYSTLETEQLYRLSFTFVGENKGSYKLMKSTANGRVFCWVAPENGELRGDYAPVVQLSTPKLVQMVTLAGQYDFRPSSSVGAELALSNYDQNTFSRNDDRDNVGFAFLLKAKHVRQLKKTNGNVAPWFLDAKADWQFVHKNFHPIESFRPVEFARDYNLAEDYSNQHSEQMLQAQVGLSNPNVSTSKYVLNYFSRLGNMMAVRNEILSDNQVGKFALNTKTSFLTTKDSLRTSGFWTSNNQLSYHYSKMEIGVKDILEHNVFKSVDAKDLLPNSHAFNEVSAFLKSDSSAYHYVFYYKNREEFSPWNNKMNIAQNIHELSAAFQIDRIKSQHFELKATYRNQSVKDSLVSSENEHYFVGDMEYTGRFLKNAIVLSTYYEAGSGMELKRSFAFMKVATGQGTHVWKDYNGDGIEDIGEFELAVFQDEADYVKIWLMGVDYMNTYNNRFTQSVQLRPAALFRDAKGFRKFLSRFSDVALFRSQSKHLNPIFNPFNTSMSDTNLIGRMLSLNNTFSFNNSASKFGFDFIVQKSLNKSLLYYGFEQSGVGLQQVILKSLVCKFLYLQADYLHSLTDNQSDYLSMRNYRICLHQGQGMVRLQFLNRYFGELSYKYARQRNLLGTENVTSQEAGLSFTFRSVKYGTALFSVQYIHIMGDSGPGNSVSYQMLKGLNVGRNAIWNLSYQVPVTGYLQLSLQYDGRVSESHGVIHTGNIIIKAQF